jgi:hypothetical protein
MCETDSLLCSRKTHKEASETKDLGPSGAAGSIQSTGCATTQPKFKFRSVIIPHGHFGGKTVRNELVLNPNNTTVQLRQAGFNIFGGKQSTICATIRMNKKFRSEHRGLTHPKV